MTSAEAEVTRAVLAERERLAEILADEAAVARRSIYGEHPDIPVRTHAAALLFAAERVRQG